MKPLKKCEFDEALDSALDHLVITEDNIEFFLQVLRETNNIFLWNILPLKIADTHDTRLVPVLIELLKDPRTRNYRGNFLGALEEYDYSQYYALLVDLIRNDNWEVRNRAACMISDIKDKLSNEEKNHMEELLSKVLEDADDRYTMIYELCDELKDN